MQANHPNRGRMDIQLVDGGSHLQIIINGHPTDLGVSKTRGYQIYKREPGLPEIALANKLGDMVGARLVHAPKKAGQVTEADLIAAVARAAKA